MTSYVLDASVILSFLLGKNRKIEIQFTKILKGTKAGKIKLYSGHLLPLEVGNGLRYTVKDELVADEIMQKFLRLPINLHDFSSAQYSKILQLCYQLSTSYYDTSYHFLAKLVNATFLTCDVEYYKKATNLGKIKLL